MILMEAYALRLRHVVAGFIHPKRKERRAAWLYNHIMLRRSIITSRLQNMLRAKFSRGPKQRRSSLSIIQQIGARFEP
jgi:hypothetical protein